MAYSNSIREEELKNEIARDFFGNYDCSKIIGNIDFCIFQGRDKNGKMNKDSSNTQYTFLIANLRTKEKKLAEKIQNKVYKYEFLK